MKLLILFLLQFFIITNAENELEPRARGHSSTIDLPPNAASRRIINDIINAWDSREALNRPIGTIFRHPDNSAWRLDLQGHEDQQVQTPGHYRSTQIVTERYAIQGGIHGSQTFAVIHIQRGITFTRDIIRNAFEQSLATRSHVYLTNDDIQRGITFPDDGNNYVSERYRQRVRGGDVWRIVWGVAAVAAEMYREFHVSQGQIYKHRPKHWKRDEEDEWRDIVSETMAKCINDESENSKIAKNAYNKLKEIFTDYRIFVSVFNYVNEDGKNDAIDSKTADNVYKKDIKGKNYAVFRFDNSKSAVTPQSTAKRNKIRNENAKIIRNLRRYAEKKQEFKHLILFVDLMIGDEYSYILAVHDKADMATSHDTDSVIILDQGGYTLWIGLEIPEKPEVINGIQNKMIMKEKMTLPEDSETSTDYSSEPTGKSTVPANSCGKRIVGYYTGWGKRDVSKSQLKKLTHIIYAFIEMKADGKIGFGGVAEDFKPDQNPAEIMKQRGMANKARKANSGIKILAAIGGWSNSQYFSSVAADAGKRSIFVTEITNFLKEYKIDGVDIDWEYPVTGGANEGIAADKENYVTLMKELREKLSSNQNSRKSPYIISIASAAGQWVLDPGYNLNGLLQHIDFINVMTYDYYGAWESQWGAYTGPPSPLYYNEVKGSSGKMNADWTMKYYSCKTKKPSKLNMGVPFYGRFWNNVDNAIDDSHPMYRTVQKVNGKFDGGAVNYRDLEASGWSLGATQFDDTVKAPFIWNSGSRKFLGFENSQSLQFKIDYAVEKNIGGIMIWAIDQDADNDILLNIVSSAALCKGGNGDDVKHKCLPIDNIRWWTFENGGDSKKGMCGKSAPLIVGFYPVCDPDDPGFACCSPAGYCGSGADFCDCEKCVNYRKNPEKIVENPVKPSIPVQWYLMDAGDGKRGRCGPDAPLLNGKHAICNPDDNSAHCCSNGYYCGTGDAFCKCDGCVDFKINPNHHW